MDNLTIGYVSGMIAAAVAIAQFVVPNALALILVATLTDRHSAVTWSVASRSLSNTHWPLFLRSDQTASQNVSRRVTFITWAKPLALLCIAVAAIVTPMGLYETIVASQDVAATAFSYVPDRGPLGLGTAPRTGLGLSRSCGRELIPKVCPGSTGSINITRDETWINATSESWEFRLPQDLAQLYQSGLKLQQSTVSSFFDIESRLYDIAFNADQANATYITDSYRPLGTFILGDKALAVEGLLVDPQNPSVGFRNHTAPVGARYGGEWDEDLLFLEPETQCVDTNITMRTDRVSGRIFPETFYLIDEGGFMNMDMENPWDAKKQFAYEGTQEDAQLGWRARAVAWTMNAYMAFFFNVTKPFEREAYMNSTMGKLFPINATGELSRNAMNQVVLKTSYYSMVSDIPYASTDPINGTVTLDNFTQTSWENPFNISQANFTLLPEFCGGVGITIRGVGNMTNIQVQCGLVFGTAQPLDGEKTLVPLPDSKWVRPVYSCASTTKAVIKTVRFRYNSTNHDPEAMNRFEVVSIADKAYSSPDAMPLWGVEEANMSILDIDPLWGLIDPAQADHVNLSTVHADHLYIPAGKSSVRIFGETSEDCMPGVSGPAKAWSRVYGSTTGGTAGVDYSGMGSLGLYNKWDNLTRSAAGTSQMLNLIWMDFAANALIGTRGHLSTSQLPPNLQPKPTRMLKRDDEQAGSGTVPVHLYHRAIRYRWVYGIPAFLTALVVALICLGAIVALLMGRASPRRVKHYLWNLSTGRIFTSFLYPGSSHVYSDTKEWIKTVGASEVTLRRSQAHGGAYSPDSATGANTNLAAVTTSYQRISQEEPKDGVREVKPRPVVGYESGRAVSSDYLVSR